VHHQQLGARGEAPYEGLLLHAGLREGSRVLLLGVGEAGRWACAAGCFVLLNAPEMPLLCTYAT